MHNSNPILYVMINKLSKYRKIHFFKAQNSINITISYIKYCMNKQ
ncbi:hypothetical protein SAMN05192581_101441 [Bacteroides ovatus]|uniref:Uncharacterized protein n=1 Tax=Bacteroides ovatus TaxID=28116 RepID=A0A1G6G4E2_BACOV|nr:hypothetical protein SAMN05192581_101441 [Bacteroides ovatus]